MPSAVAALLVALTYGILPTRSRAACGWIALRRTSDANKRVEQQLSATRDEAAKRIADAERHAAALIEDAKRRAGEEAAKIVAQAKAEADQQLIAAREQLREDVASLAVKGAEQILRKEVNASVHADLLNRLKAEL